MTKQLTKAASIAYSTRETIQNSFDIGKMVAELSVPGAVVECGLGAGANFAAMILGYESDGQKGTYFGFDSFEGIQLAGPKDSEQPGIGAISHDVNVSPDQLLVSSGITVHSMDNVWANLAMCGIKSDNITLVKGWVQNTIPGWIKTIGSISVLRLDMDIYEPTLFALRLLFPLVAPGGVVIIDDWALSGARLACEEYFSAIGYQPKYRLVENSTPVWFVKK